MQSVPITKLLFEGIEQHLNFNEKAPAIAQNDAGNTARAIKVLVLFSSSLNRP